MNIANTKAEQFTSELDVGLSVRQIHWSDIGRIASMKNKAAIITLILILAATVTAYCLLLQDAEKNRFSHFTQKTAAIVSSIEARLHAHEHILLGVAGLFNASAQVDRNAFKLYVDRLQLEKNSPGILAVGFAKVIEPEELQLHIASVRAEGFPGYSVHPLSAFPLITSIIFIEPFSGRNLAAFGYDMYTEPTRQKAMQQAAENAQTIITDKVKLVQENQENIQAGFLMYVPIYRNNFPMETPVERMHALLGFSYSPYRMNDLMKGIMGRNSADIEFKIYSNSKDTLMYDSTENHPDGVTGKYQQVQRISAYGVNWTIAFKSNADFDAVNSASLPLVVLIMGTSIGLLLFGLMSLALQQRDRAIQLALKMTQEIREQGIRLSDSEERFELAMCGANDGVWDRNLELGTVYYSPRWKMLLGYADNELPNFQEEWKRRVHPDDIAQLIKKEKHYLDSSVERFQNEYRLRHKDGRYIWVIDRGLIQFGANGKASRLVGVISDITEQKRIDKLKSEFFSTVSHELRTPLTSITASLGLLEAGVFGDLPAKALGLVGIANKNSKRLTLLVNDILDMEKLMSGSSAFRTDQIDMMQIVKQSIELNNDYANSYGVQFILLTPTGTHLVLGDRDRLMQIMANLMSNAAKFSPVGSVVEIRLIRQMTTVRIEVEDQGTGIADEFRTRIFTVFAQADSSDSRQQGGTGLGLNLTKKIVERMGGEIGYETELGKGSIFWFTLPYLSV